MATNYPGTGGRDYMKAWRDRSAGFAAQRKNGVSIPQGPTGYNVGDRYYQNAYAQIAPIMERGIRDARAGLADQGIIGSTGGQGKLSDIRQQYLAQASQMAEQNRQQDRTFTEAQRQANMSAAMRAFEMLSAQALGKKQLGIVDKNIRWPVDPKMFAWLAKQQYAPVGDPPENEMGDPREGEEWGRVNQTLGSTLADRQLAQEASDRAAARAMENARFAWQKKMDMEALAMAREKAEENTDDPWNILAGMVADNYAEDMQDFPGFQAKMLPSQLMQLFTTSTGIDVTKAVNEGTPQAMAAVERMYPKTVTSLKSQYGNEWFKYFKGAQAPAAPSSAVTAAARLDRPTPSRTPLQQIAGSPAGNLSGWAALGAVNPALPVAAIGAGTLNTLGQSARNAWNWLNTPR